MRLATTTADFGDYKLSICERIEHVCEAGFKYIDLSLNDRVAAAALFESGFEDAVKALADTAKKYGAEFVQAHAPAVNCFEEGKYEQAVFTAVRSVEICGMLGIKNLVIHPGWDYNIKNRSEWYEKNKGFFSELFPAMEKNGVNVLCENGVNLPYTDVPAEHMPNGYSIITGADMKKFIRYVDHPLFHACWDIGHANVNFSGSHYKEITDLGSELYAIHFHDNDGTHDYHLIPYMGIINPDEIMHALISTGFKGPLTFEAVTPLRASDFWLGERRSFADDTRLAEPPLAARKKLEEFLYTVGESILRAYDCFEE